MLDRQELIWRFLNQQSRRAKALSFRGQRIGVYPGAFDPVHAGHITLALQAIEASRLDLLVFLPERQPSTKRPFEHFGHRTAMIRRAIKPHPNLAILELADKHFSFERAWPKLEALFRGAQLFLVIGSDVVMEDRLPKPIGRQMAMLELTIGLLDSSPDQVATKLSQTGVNPKAVNLFQSYAPEVSAAAVRAAIAERRHIKGLLASVFQYADKEWLYLSLKDI